MLSVDDVYCKPFACDPIRAASVQNDVAYVFCHFNDDTREVTRALDNIRSVFFEALHIDSEEQRALLGLTSASLAFGVGKTNALPLSPDDTRIAMIIGKPFASHEKDHT